MTKYKIEKKWSDTFECWEWFAYEQIDFGIFKSWNKISSICEETKEMAESQLLSYAERRADVEKDKLSGPEEYFLDL